MVKFKPKLLFFKIWGGAFAPPTNSVPSPLLNSKASAKEEAISNNGKACIEEESGRGKTFASNDTDEVTCSRTTNAVEH
jgi:hypothetical protein